MIASSSRTPRGDRERPSILPTNAGHPHHEARLSAPCPPHRSNLAHLLLDDLPHAQLVAVSRFDRRPPERDTDSYQRADPRTRGSPDRRERRAGRHRPDPRRPRARPRERPRPGRGLPDIEAARLPDPRLLEVQVRAGAEGQAGPQAPAAGERPRDQASSEDRPARLRDQARPCRALPEATGQGQGDNHVPRPRAEPPRARAGCCSTGCCRTSPRSA